MDGHWKLTYDSDVYPLLKPVLTQFTYAFHYHENC